MKIIHLKTYFILVLMLSLVIGSSSCGKVVENKAPTCSITSPENGSEFEQGETIIISVNADDSDGSITEVRFYIDNIGVGSSTAFPYNYSWNTTDTDEGIHTIKATSKDNGGLFTSSEISILIVNGGGGGGVPVADFSFNPSTVIVGTSVQFTDLSSNTPTEWLWDFGLGNTSTEQNPIHTFNETGNYAITLTVTNSSGTDSETKSISVNETGNGPIADFVADQTSVPLGTTVQFTDLSTNEPSEWLWDFGNGISSNQQHTFHNYSEAGVYSISLTVSNSNGTDTETKTDYITVTSGSGNGCEGVTSFSYEGQVYQTVEIGNQCWMTENLNFATATGSWCYDSDEANCDIYGRLYSWGTAVNACPEGWHLPNDIEWKILAGNVDTQFGEEDATWNDWGLHGHDVGKRLKSSSGWYLEGNGTDNYGFKALPGSYRDIDGTFSYLGEAAYFWTSNEMSSLLSNYRSLVYNSDQIARQSINKAAGFSVRCVKD